MVKARHTDSSNRMLIVGVVVFLVLVVGAYFYFGGQSSSSSGTPAGQEDSWVLDSRGIYVKNGNPASGLCPGFVPPG